MNRTAGTELGSIRLAFWGYTNCRGAQAARNLARQLRRCRAVLDGRAQINRFFYEMPEPIGDLMALAVRGAGGPSHHDGGWDDLAAVLPETGRGFEAIICESDDRLGRRCSRLLEREELAAQHRVTILSAHDPTLCVGETLCREAARLQRLVRTKVSGCDHGMAESSVRRIRRRICG